MRTIRLWAWVGLGLILAACGGKDSNTPAASQVQISPNRANLVPGETLQFTAAVKSPSGGIIENAAFSWESSDPSIVTVDSNGLAMGVKLGIANVVVSTANKKESALVGVVSPNTGTLFDLSGKALYEDKPFDVKGFTGGIEPTAIRNAAVNIIAIDGFVQLASGSTDNKGEFSFTGVPNNVRRGGFYLQVLAKTADGNPTQVEIRNNATDRSILAHISSALDDSTTATFAGIETAATASSGIGGAFNILDTLSQASELIQKSGPCPSLDGRCIPPLLTAYWEPGSADGTHYDDQLDAIFILGGGTADKDADEYDDSVIAHEYGHFAVRHFSRDDSPGGQHRINENGQDIRLAWSEGWGDFFSSAVRQSPLYVDTANGSTFSFDIESYTSPNFPIAGSLSAKTIYTTNEIAIAGVLWDVLDPIAGPLDLDEQHDQLALGFNPIWQTLLQFQKTEGAALPATMESFQILFNIIDPASSNALTAILEERKMELFPDSADSSGGVEVELKPNEPDLDNTQHHTLYVSGPNPVGDEDMIPFSVQPNKTYTIETLNLTNGADTLLILKDGTSVLFENDNRNKASYQNCAVSSSGSSSCPLNDKTALSSSISFTWTGPPSTLNAHVQHAPKAPPSAGRLGVYDIKLTVK
jgi:hypothetical protein